MNYEESEKILGMITDLEQIKLLPNIPDIDYLSEMLQDKHLSINKFTDNSLR